MHLFNSWENMENKNDMFYRIISGYFPRDIYWIIEAHSNLVLHYEYDAMEDVGNMVISDDGNILLKMESPKLPYISGDGATVAQKAASCQRQIDFWLRLLAENLEYMANAHVQKQLNVQVKHSLIHKHRMYWISHDINEHCVYIHPYVKKYYPADYEEIRHQKEQEGYAVYIDIFEAMQYELFEKHGIDCLRIEEDNF